MSLFDVDNNVVAKIVMIMSKRIQAVHVHQIY